MLSERLWDQVKGLPLLLQGAVESFAVIGVSSAEAADSAAGVVPAMILVVVAAAVAGEPFVAAVAAPAEPKQQVAAVPQFAAAAVHWPAAD
jgi:hypothetical protein